VKRIHAASAAALVVLAVPALAGCFNGQAATTTTQATMNSGNGVEATQGAINIDGAVLVLGPEGSGTATLTTRVVNAGLEPDALTFVSINGIPAYVTEGAGELPAGASISFGYESDAWINSYDLDVPPSTYVPVQIGFEKAGLVTLSLLTVPPAGYYEGIAPNPPANPVAAS
jgi:hypothetical protein